MSLKKSLATKMNSSDSSVMTVPGGVALKRTCLEISRELSFDEWLSLGKLIAHAEGAVQWWIGDFLEKGSAAYGEKYAQAVSPQQADLWRHYAWISRKVHPDIRRATLTHKHHEAVAPMEHKEQNEWLDKAEKNSWTVSELRQSIKGEAEKKPRVVECPDCGAVFVPDRNRFIGGER